MPTSALKFASILSVCGEFDLGLIQQGFQPFGAYNCDPEAVGTLSQNITDDVYSVDLPTNLPLLDLTRL